MPRATFRWVRMSRWNASSSSTSSRGLGRTGAADSGASAADVADRRSCHTRLAAQHARDRLRVAEPDGRFGAEVLSTGAGDRVIARPAIVLGEPPLGTHESAILEAAEGGVEGALLDAEDVGRRIFDPPGDGVAVRGAGQEGLENENAERALEQVAGVLRGMVVPLARIGEQGMGGASLVKAMGPAGRRRVPSERLQAVRPVG